MQEVLHGNSGEMNITHAQNDFSSFYISKFTVSGLTLVNKMRNMGEGYGFIFLFIFCKD